MWYIEPYNKPKTDIFLGVYSDPFGIASILFNVEDRKYNIQKLWFKTGLISLSEGARESINLLTGIPYNYAKAYLNNSKCFELVFRQESKQFRFSYIYTTELDPLEGYQLINSLLAENRITIVAGLTDIESALKSFDISQVDPIVYSLFSSIGQMELDTLRPTAQFGTARGIW